MPLRRPLEGFIAAFVAALRIKPSEVAQRHPMGLFKEDEDDICLTIHHQTSEICWCAVSHIESFLVRFTCAMRIRVVCCAMRR